MIASTSPPMPVECGSVTHRTAAAQIAASIAVPPSRKTSRPASVASGWLDATIASEATDAARAGVSANDIDSGPRRAEPLGADPARVTSAVGEPTGRRLDERVRAADVDPRPFLRRSGDLVN